MQPERGREQRIVERHEFQAIWVVAPRRRKGTVVSRLPRKVPLYSKSECTREEKSRNRHERLEPFGPLFPEVSVRLFVSLQQIREDRLEVQYLVHVDTSPV